MKIYFKIKSILNSSQKKALVFIILLLIIGVVVEIFGLGLMLPTLAMLVQPTIKSENSVMSKIILKLGNPSQNELVIIFMTTLVIFYIFKLLFLLYSSWRQSKFSADLTSSLSRELFLGYMSAPYSFHLQKNSSELIRNIQNETAMFTSLSQSFMFLATEFAVLIGVCVMLFIIEPIGTISISLFIVLAILFFHGLTKNKIKKWGNLRQFHVGETVKKLLQGLGGVKDIKLLGREKYFLDEFDSHNVSNANVLTKVATVEQFPRLYLELLAVVGLAGMTFSMILQNKPVGDLIPTLGVFVAAAFRMIPSINRIMAALQKVTFSRPVIEVIYNELKEIRKIKRDNIEPIPKIHLLDKITIENINYAYNDSNKNVLENVCFSIFKGSCVGIIGKSGSGKSTLIDIMLGLLQPTQGYVKIDAMDINGNDNLKKWQSAIGYVPQNIYLIDDTLRKNIAFGINENEIDEYAIQNSIIASQLSDFVNELPEGLETMVGERGVRLSGGQRQRIGIARALYNNPDILFFDEATSALDSNTETGVMESINSLKGNKTIIIVAHRLSTLENCDKIYKIENGIIVSSGSSKEMLN